MSGCANKPCVGIIRDLGAIDPEWRKVNEALWLFVGKPIASRRTAHQEFSGRNQCHVDRQRRAER
jgi:hypothetical protein